MNEQQEQVPFVVTKGYQLFADLCDACRRFRSIGLGYVLQAQEKPNLPGIMQSGSIWSHLCRKT
jgi:hypothetical protein